MAFIATSVSGTASRSAHVVFSVCLLSLVTGLQHRLADSSGTENALCADPTVLFAEDGLPPRLGPNAPIDPVQAAKTIQNLQTFIGAELRDGYTSIVIMGDSTMSGVVSNLLGISEEAEQHKWLLHTTNDRPVAVHFTNDHSAVAPGGEWYEPDAQNSPVAKLVLERSQAAQESLHSMNCTWAGGVSTYLFTGGPLEGLVVHDWGFIPEYGDACWKPCMPEAVKAFKASAVLWNIGFHLLNQKFDKEICARRQNMAKENCGDYKELVKMGTHQFLDVVPIVIFRSTNHLCEAKHRDFICTQLVTEYDWWQNDSMRPQLEEACHENCPLIANHLKCYDFLMSSRATDLFYEQSINAIVELQAEVPLRASRIHMLDAYESSKQCCDSSCNATDDGEHYTGLDRGLVDQLAVLLARSV